MRKSPVQGRSQATVETILEASAQILHREGEAALTTNRIAAHAGFSIGTLYQYFPNRDAILAAMAEREQRRVLARLETELATLDPADPEPAVRQAIRTFLGAFRGRHGVRRAIILATLRRLPKDAKDNASLAEPMLEAIEARCAGHFEPLGEAGRYVLLRAVAGAVRSAAFERSPLLGTEAFEEALVRLVMGMLRPIPATPRRLPEGAGN
ncbi:TetR/AcrR family transcriptional regulator [Roseomonas eburnea]|uniref:TetR/AcrR family transcriptional regulator n=2 Tax=Neoroseomonas eburnea TaxID=1346889 RepID=A0A9X9XFU9_9PROT|nr:TetR/AcrR family transcriptional regulator [Neoroseomonas eburnea]